MAENGEQGREEEEVVEISSGSVWSASTTQMLIFVLKRKWKQNKSKESHGATYCSV